MSDILAYISDFLSLVFERGIEKNIKEIILFGSVAKGNFSRKSDIDLFFNIKDKKKAGETEEEIKSALRSFEVKAERTWGLKKINLPINFISGSLEDSEWESLRGEISSSGILLYGKHKEVPQKLAQNYIVYYSLNSLGRKDKMKFIRKMFGYSIKKADKEYSQEGFISRIHGTKLGPNALLVPAEEIAHAKEIFREFKLDCKLIESWIRI